MTDILEEEFYREQAKLWNSSDDVVATAADVVRTIVGHLIEQTASDERDEAPILELQVDRFFRKMRWRGILANYVAYALGAGCYWNRGEGDAQLMIVGRVARITFAKELYRCLHDEVLRLVEVQSALPSPEPAQSVRTRKYNLRLEMVGVIGQRIREARDEAINGARSPALANSPPSGLARLDANRNEV